MDPSRWGSFELWLEPRGLGRPQPINGPRRQLFDVDRQEMVAVPTGGLAAVLAELDASYAQLEWGQEYGDRLHAQGVVMGFRSARRRPACEVCSDPLPLQPLDTDATIYCSSCGAPHLVRPAPFWLTAEVPTAVQIYGGEAEDQEPSAAQTDPAFGMPQLTVRRWYVRFEGEPELELEPVDDDSTEEEFLARLGVSEDPRELIKALEYAVNPMAREQIEQLLEALRQRERGWEVQAEQLARPWVWAGWAVGLAYLPLGLALAALTWLAPVEVGGRLVEASPGVELLALVCLAVMFPSVWVAQKAVQTRGGLPEGEAFNEIGFQAALSLVPIFGGFTALLTCSRLVHGQLGRLSVTDGEGRLLRPWPVDGHIGIGRCGWPAALVLFTTGLAGQAVWLQMLWPYLSGEFSGWLF